MVPKLTHYFAVHELAWHNDSHLGDFKTLAEAVKVAREEGSQSREHSRVQIYSVWHIALPFGWQLTRETRLTDWRE